MELYEVMCVRLLKIVKYCRIKNQLKKFKKMEK